MPTYEYECSKCGATFEVVQSMKDAPLRDCILPGCGGKRTVKRLIGAGIGVIFKGSGFYQTDYKKNGSSGKSSQKADAAPTATPAAEKPATESPAKPGGCACGGGGTCGE